MSKLERLCRTGKLSVLAAVDDPSCPWFPLRASQPAASWRRYFGRSMILFRRGLGTWKPTQISSIPGAAVPGGIFIYELAGLASQNAELTVGRCRLANCHTDTAGSGAGRGVNPRRVVRCFGGHPRWDRAIRCREILHNRKD